MSHGPRATGGFPATSGTSSMRQSMHPSSSTQQSSILSARIVSKRAELEDLKQLRDVSNDLATQMESLEQKLSTLRDGTESVACVMANWDNVLRAVNMASTKASKTGGSGTAESDTKAPLVTPLVRIPAEEPSPLRKADSEE